MILLLLSGQGFALVRGATALLTVPARPAAVLAVPARPSASVAA